MRGNLEARINKLEERRRPVAAIEPKVARDAKVKAWGSTLPDAIPSDPQQRAAILAGMRADT